MQNCRQENQLSVYARMCAIHGNLQTRTREILIKESERMLPWRKWQYNN